LLGLIDPAPYAADAEEAEAQVSAYETRLLYRGNRLIAL
jgi:hypothetical protein